MGAKGLQLKRPLKCHLWINNRISSEDMQFSQVKTYYESSHFDRHVVRCNKCGQLYFAEFYEVVDMIGGRDDMYNTWIPVSSIKQANELATRTTLELLLVKPRLQLDPDFFFRWVA